MTGDEVPSGYAGGYSLDGFGYRRTTIAVHGRSAKVGHIVTLATSDDTTFMFATLTAITSDTAVEVTTADGQFMSFTDRGRGVWVLRRQRVTAWHWCIESVAVSNNGH